MRSGVCQVGDSAQGAGEARCLQPRQQRSAGSAVRTGDERDGGRLGREPEGIRGGKKRSRTTWVRSCSPLHCPLAEPVGRPY
jgi:hypothetical protein